MIIISKPYLESDDDNSFLKASIHDDKRNKDYLIWYSVENEYRNYLCTENADGFLLLALMVAIQSHQDIKVEAPVSRKFLFNLNNYVIPLFTKIIPNGQTIRIEANEISTTVFDARGVGCGCSMGVDSLSALYTHLDEGVINGYRVTHLATFNSGHFGDVDQKGAEAAFYKEIKELRPLSVELGLPIVAINTNLNEFFWGSPFMTHLSRLIPSTISCVFALQKLFGKYVFASSNSIDEFKIIPFDHVITEAALVPVLSTENVEVILSCATMTRVEKTDFIRSNPLTSRYLNVCWADPAAYGFKHNRKYLDDRTKMNCGWCSKCLRTLYTLELLGEDIGKYGDIFDLDKYYQHKQGFIENVYLYRNKDELYKEIYDYMIKTGQDRFPFGVYIKGHILWLKGIAKRVDKRIRRLIKGSDAIVQGESKHG